MFKYSMFNFVLHTDIDLSTCLKVTTPYGLQVICYFPRNYPDSKALKITLHFKDNKKVFRYVNNGGVIALYLS